DVVSLPVTASDPNGDTVTYTATGLPTGLSIGASTGVISGTISTGADSGSPYSVTVTASDGSLQGSTSFSWAVSNPATQPAVRLLAGTGQALSAVVPVSLDELQQAADLLRGVVPDPTLVNGGAGPLALPDLGQLLAQLSADAVQVQVYDSTGH